MENKRGLDFSSKKEMELWDRLGLDDNRYSEADHSWLNSRTPKDVIAVSSMYRAMLKTGEIVQLKPSDSHYEKIKEFVKLYDEKGRDYFKECHTKELPESLEYKRYNKRELK